MITKTDIPSRPLVSIITVVYNDVDNLEETILSVINQSYPHVEYVIIDGGSKDGTLEIIKKYSDRISYWISEPDHGIYDAMNKGIDVAKGAWINLMNCGDRFASNETLEIFSELTTDADIIYGDAVIEYPTFQTLVKRYPLTLMWREMPFCHQASFVKSSLLKEYKFNLQYRLSADFEFLYRSYVSNRKFVFIDKVLCIYDYKEGASRDQKFQSIDERRKASLALKNSAGKHLYYFFYLLYIKITLFTKRVIGDKASEWITRRLRA